MSEILEPKIIFTNEQLLILNKPAGWLTHPSGRGDAPAVTDWLIAHYPLLATIGLPERLQDGTLIPRAGILHRLDRETSGVLAVGKTSEAFEWFTRAFRERTVAKVYRAIVSGVVKPDDGVINLPIGRSRQDPRRRVASKKAHGELRPAITNFHALERFAKHTYLELKPETGRTHQLRAHLKAIQHPILGDTLYAPKGLAVPTISRTALHAYSLTLPLINGEKISFVAPLPEDFSQTLDSLRSAC
jgi:23S rRNA pseudouridine1911/1915/1917 synthase